MEGISGTIMIHTRGEEIRAEGDRQKSGTTVFDIHVGALSLHIFDVTPADLKRLADEALGFALKLDRIEQGREPGFPRKAREEGAAPG